MNLKQRITVPTSIAHVPDPATLLAPFIDIQTAANLLGRARSTVYDMVERGLLNRYEVGTQALYWGPQVVEVAAALERLRVRA